MRLVPETDEHFLISVQDVVESEINISNASLSLPTRCLNLLGSLCLTFVLNPINSFLILQSRYRGPVKFPLSHSSSSTPQNCQVPNNSNDSYIPGEIPLRLSLLAALLVAN